MSVFRATLDSVAILLTVGLLGFIMLSRRLVPAEALRFLSPLALDLALPSLIFISMVKKFEPSVNPDWWHYPLWWLLLTLFTGVMTFLLSFLSARDSRPEFAMSLFFQNGVFFPLGILSSIYGPESKHVINLFFFTLFYPAFFFNTAHLFLKKGKKIKEEPHPCTELKPVFVSAVPETKSSFFSKVEWHRIFNPLFNATITGLIFYYLSLVQFLPAFFISSLKMVGETAIPLLFLMLGGNIYLDLKQKQPFRIPELLKFVFAKNILMPLAGLSFLLLIRPPDDVAVMLMLQCAVPPLTILPAITEREGGQRPLVDGFMVSSFLFSLVSVPLSMHVFKFFFPASF